MLIEEKEFMETQEIPHPWNKEQGDCGVDAASDSGDLSEEFLRKRNSRAHAVPGSSIRKDGCRNMID